jgi:hypothetical protein
MVYDNSCLPSHQRVMRDRPSVRMFPANGTHVELDHAAARYHLVRQTPPTIPYVITLDSGAFPISDGWIDRLISAVQAGNAVSGIYRDEMSSYITPFVHPSGLFAHRDDLLAYGVSVVKGDGQDIGQQLFDVLSRNRPYYPLRRSNVRSVHAVMGGVYGDVIYHHGAGSRRPQFLGHPRKSPQRCRSREITQRGIRRPSPAGVRTPGPTRTDVDRGAGERRRYNARMRVVSRRPDATQLLGGATSRPPSRAPNRRDPQLRGSAVGSSNG